MCSDAIGIANVVYDEIISGNAFTSRYLSPAGRCFDPLQACKLQGIFALIQRWCYPISMIPGYPITAIGYYEVELFSTGNVGVNSFAMPGCFACDQSAVPG